MTNTCGHPERKHRAKGMCNSCYYLHYTNTHPEFKAKKQAKTAEYNIDRDTTTYNREYYLAKKYNLSEQQYQDMCKAQQYICAICKLETDLVVDHNHKPPYQVRALLCQKCNSGIGMLNDDPELVFAAFMYLSKEYKLEPTTSASVLPQL